MNATAVSFCWNMPWITPREICSYASVSGLEIGVMPSSFVIFSTVVPGTRILMPLTASMLSKALALVKSWYGPLVHSPSSTTPSCSFSFAKYF